MYTFRDLRHNSPSLSQHRFSLCEYHGSTGWDSSTNKSLHMAVGEREGLSRAIQGLFSTFFSASWKEWKNIIQRNMAFTLTLCSPWLSQNVRVANNLVSSSCLSLSSPNASQVHIMCEHSSVLPIPLHECSGPSLHEYEQLSPGTTKQTSFSVSGISLMHQFYGCARAE